jgi:CxxC-x17-CxxC domain-containing protein
LVYTDRVMACIDCGQEFTFTAGEQEFYAQRGFTEAPKRCAQCRALRKTQRGASAGGGGYSSGSSGSSYGDSYSGGGGGSGYAERRPREMFAATCADCGKTAQVPFQPTGARPVYCSDCFQSHR